MRKFVVGTYYCFKQYSYLRNRPPTDKNINTNIKLLLDSWTQEPKFWLYLGIATAVILVIIFLVVLVLRKRIVIAIALVKEGSKYVNSKYHYKIFTNNNHLLYRAVSSIYSTVFFPIIPWILQITVAVFAIAVGLYLASIGTPVNQVLRMSEDSNCHCTGSASHYTVILNFIQFLFTFEGFYSEKLCESSITFDIRSNEIGCVFQCYRNE